MRRSFLFILFSIALLTLVIAGCSKNGAADPNEVVATVNGENITRAEFTERLEKIAGQQILDQMITEKLILMEGEKKKVSPTDAEVDAELKSTVQRFGGDEQFKAFLERRGETMEEAKERIVLQLTVQALVADKAKVTEEQIKSEYEANKDTLYAGKTYAQAKPDIKKQLEEQEVAKLIPAYIQELKDKAEIDNKLAPETTTTTKPMAPPVSVLDGDAPKGETTEEKSDK